VPTQACQELTPLLPPPPLQAFFQSSPISFLMLLGLLPASLAALLALAIRLVPEAQLHSPPALAIVVPGTAGTAGQGLARPSAGQGGQPSDPQAVHHPSSTAQDHAMRPTASQAAAAIQATCQLLDRGAAAGPSRLPAAATMVVNPIHSLPPASADHVPGLQPSPGPRWQALQLRLGLGHALVALLALYQLSASLLLQAQQASLPRWAPAALLAGTLALVLLLAAEVLLGPPSWLLRCLAPTVRRRRLQDQPASSEQLQPLLCSSPSETMLSAASSGASWPTARSAGCSSTGRNTAWASPRSSLASASCSSLARAGEGAGPGRAVVRPGSAASLLHLGEVSGVEQQWPSEEWPTALGAASVMAQEVVEEVAAAWRRYRSGSSGGSGSLACGSPASEYLDAGRRAASQPLLQEHRAGAAGASRAASAPPLLPQLQQQQVSERASVPAASALPAALQAAEEAQQHGLPAAVTLLGSLRTLRLWLLLAITALAVGSSLVYVNSLGELVLALGGSRQQQDMHVALFSVGNCCGRLLLGLVPEALLVARGTPRPAFLLAVVLLEAGVNAGTAYAPLPLLTVSSLVAGVSLGGLWALLPVVASDLFGLSHVASILGLVAMAPAAGGYVLSELAGRMYDAAAAGGGGGGQGEWLLGEQVRWRSGFWHGAGLLGLGGGGVMVGGWSLAGGGGGGDGGGNGHAQHDCLGPHCFRGSFQALAGLCLAAALLAALLLVHTGAMYVPVVRHLRQVRSRLQREAVQPGSSSSGSVVWR
jgi:hypothetical protein